VKFIETQYTPAGKKVISHVCGEEMGFQALDAVVL